MKGYTILVLRPTSFKEADDAIAALKAGQVLLLNFSRLKPHSKQRITDYIAGSTYALAGQTAEVGNDVFLFTPPAIDITSPSSQSKYPPMQAQSA